MTRFLVRDIMHSLIDDYFANRYIFVQSMILQEAASIVTEQLIDGPQPEFEVGL